ncbi:MAG: LamG domain-containing protein [Candidatus Saccharimonas sp.]
MALVSEYSFSENNGSTTTADITGNGYDLSVVGSPFTAGGHSGNGMRGGTTTDRAEGPVGPNTLFQDWTVMGWVKLDGYTDPYRAVLADGNNFYLEFTSYAGGLRIECYSGTAYWPNGSTGYTTTTGLGVWMHVAATRSAGTDYFGDGPSKVYVNGVEVASGNGRAYNFANPGFEVGSVGNGAGYNLDGTVDTLRVFDEALTEEQIAAWMNTPAGAKPPVLLASYGFLENDYTSSIADSSNNGHTGAVTGSLAFEDGPQGGSRALRFTNSLQAVAVPRTGLEPTAAGGGIVTMGWFRSFGGSSLGLVVKKRDESTSTRSGITVYPNGSVFFVARWKDDAHFGEYGSNMNDGNWHHAAVVDGDTAWAFYIDGVQVDGGSRSFNQSTSPTWDDFPWTFGYVDGLSNTNDSFTISGVRIFSGTMSQAEIQTYMNTPVVTQGIPTPMGAWSFDHVNGTTVYDDSGNGINGTASDAAILSGTDITFTESGTSGGFGIKQSVDFPRARLEPFLAYTVMVSARRSGNVGVGDDAIFVKPRATQSTRIGLYLTSSDLFYVVTTPGSAGNREFANLPITLDTNWHHYAVTMANNGDWVIYQDGVVVGGGNIPPSGGFMAWEDSTWTIGTNTPADLGGNEAGMNVDDFRIFSQALTQSQVQYYMNNPVIPPGRKLRLGGSPKPLRLGSVEKFFGST